MILTRKTLLFALILAGASVLISCGNDEDPVEDPAISLDKTTVSAKAGESISAVVTYETPEGFKNLTIAKKIDDTEVDSEVITTDNGGTYEFEYDVLVEDAEGILTFTFTVTDELDATVSTDLIVEVELTTEQLLLKYDWQLSEEVREKTGENEVNEAYTDDVYRFNADGTYAKSAGERVDDFGDLWYNYCYWNFNEAENRLIMTRTGAFLEDVRDTLYITTINDAELEADVTYYGLDAFNTGEEEVPYESVEEFKKVFAAKAKGANFDPYQAGTEDDAGPAGTCNDVDFE